MNYKYRITNNTGAKAGGANKRNLFMAVAGKAIKPGESCYAVRLDQSAKNQQANGDITIEEGNFVIGSDLSPKKPAQAKIVNLDDDGEAPPYKPPVVHTSDEPLPERADSTTAAKVSVTGSGPTPKMHDPSEPFKDRWQGVPKAKPPEPVAPADMPERFVMPPREGAAEKTAAVPADKGGVAALPANFDPDNDAPNFGGSDTDVAAAVSSAPVEKPNRGGKDKGSKK